MEGRKDIEQEESKRSSKIFSAMEEVYNRAK